MTNGDPDWISRHIHRLDQPLVREAIQQATETKGTFELKHRVMRAHGTLGWTLSRAIPILDDSREIRTWTNAASKIRDADLQKGPTGSFPSRHSSHPKVTCKPFQRRARPRVSKPPPLFLRIHLMAK
ncbi:PAS domain-containing protein [Terriglobus sp. TAA 43]|uniref:PAS domain-containing protein n=1 Tax=Terriglobus sp. TAA 43 TaxID=278961 RepID=UPI000A050538